VAPPAAAPADGLHAATDVAGNREAPAHPLSLSLSLSLSRCLAPRTLRN
jgi:hypothetical protein